MTSSLDPPCPQCARPLAQRAYDKCMYCGAALPVEMRLSEAEKEENRQRIRDAVEADKRRDAEKRELELQNKGRGNSSTASWGFLAGGGDSGGGGDCGSD